MHFSFILEERPALSKITLKFTGSDQKEHLVSTPLRIAADMWDSLKQRPKNIYLKTYKKLNVKLDRLRIAITAYLKQLEAKKEIFSADLLGRRIKKNCTQKYTVSYPPESLLHYTEQYIQSRLHLITRATYKRYIVFLRLMERFEGYRMQTLLLGEVNASFVKAFLAFGLQEEYSNSTIYRTVHFVRTVLNHLEKRGIRTFAYELELPKEKPQQKNFVTLSEEELIKVKKTAVPNELEAAKDWLVISCYTGQRVSDFMNFNHHIVETVKGKNYLSFVQQKTQKNILLPLHPAVLELLAKNGNHFPKKIPVQKYNEQIREVVKLAGIDALVSIHKRRGFRAFLQRVPKYEAVSSHIGRRSFASNFYGQIPTPLLMEATGHSTEEMFQRYIAGADKLRAQTLAMYFENASCF